MRAEEDGIAVTDRSDKATLWRAAYRGDYSVVLEMLNRSVIADINDLHEGKTLLFQLALGDGLDSVAPGPEYTRIARLLLERGADMHKPATNEAPQHQVIDGETTFEIAKRINSETTISEVFTQSCRRNSTDLLVKASNVWIALKEHPSFPPELLRKQVSANTKKCVNTTIKATLGVAALAFFYYCGPTLLKALKDDLSNFP